MRGEGDRVVTDTTRGTGHQHGLLSGHVQHVQRLVGGQGVEGVRRGCGRVDAGRVDYELTALGVSLLPVMQAIHDWAEAHMARVRAAREAYDAEGASESA